MQSQNKKKRLFIKEKRDLNIEKRKKKENGRKRRTSKKTD